MRTRRLTLMAALTAVALTIFVAEAQIPPPVPIMGVKLGLANIVTLASLVVLGKREAGLILTARILLGTIFTGAMSALIFSAAGGALASLATATTVRHFREDQLWIVSVFGAIAHNAGQLLAAVFVTGTAAILWYGTVLLASAIVTGLFCGFAAGYLAAALRKLRF